MWLAAIGELAEQIARGPICRCEIDWGASAPGRLAYFVGEQRLLGATARVVDHVVRKRPEGRERATARTSER